MFATKSIFRQVVNATLLFAFVCAAGAIAPNVYADDTTPRIESTEQEKAIVNKFLGRSKEKKHIRRTGYVAVSVNGGLLDGGDYDRFSAYNNSNIYRTDGGTDVLGQLSNSQELNVEFGLMTGERSAFSLGMAYWLQNGSSNQGDFVLGVEPLGTQNAYTLRSEIKVYGVSSGGEFYLTNPPDVRGEFQGLSVALGADVGYYFTKWSLWEGTGNINLSTGLFEQVSDPLTGQSLGFGGSLRFAYPTGIFGAALGLEAGYTQLKFSEVSWQNASGESIYATYSNNASDRVELDFSGFRGKFELRKFMSW